MPSEGSSFRIGRWLTVRTLEGEPWRIGERELTPVVKSISVGSGRWGIRWLRPAVVREASEEGVREIPIRGIDVPWPVLIAALVAPIALSLLIRRRG